MAARVNNKGVYWYLIFTHSKYLEINHLNLYHDHEFENLSSSSKIIPREVESGFSTASATP